jgi:hypothetical protein
LGIRVLILTGPPRIKVGKKSEHSSEGELAKLVCKSDASYPPITDWFWFKTSDTGEEEVRAVRLRTWSLSGAKDQAAVGA